MLPNFFLIGAQKCGTTFVQVCLSEHPDVFLPLEEIPFFEDPCYSESDVRALERLFEAGKHKKAVGIKRPNYLCLPECPERIHKHAPSARLIVILRDPVDRAVSAYYHYARMGFGPTKHVNIGLPGILSGSHVNKYPRAEEIIEFGFYHRCLKRYLDYFGQSQMLIMLYDEIVENRLNGIKKICTFLDIEPEYVPLSLASRPQASMYSIPRLKLIALRNAIMYSYSSDGMRLTSRDNMARRRAMLVRIIDLVDQKVLSPFFSSPRPTLSSHTEKALSDLYTADTLKLEGLLNRSLGHWKVFRPSP